MKYFIPLKKIDEEKRLVYGIATAEEVDRMDEIMDYESSKPYIEAWSDETKAQTKGDSLGNVRAMHDAISAGKLTAIDFDDAKKMVSVCAKIVDDAEWQKVLQSVYTGFSFGGYAVKRWKDEEFNAMRYTLSPCELSLADRPCVPSAVFCDIVKADGSIKKIRLKGRIVVKNSKVKKTMDLSEFSELINNVDAGLGEDENAPQDLKDAVDQLAAVLNTYTQPTEEKTDGEGEDGGKPAAGDPADPEGGEDPAAGEDPGDEGAEDPEEKPDSKDLQKMITAAVASAIKPLNASIEKINKDLKSNKETLDSRLSKVEKAAAPSKIILKTAGAKLKKTAETEEPESAVEAIKKAHAGQATWAY